MGQRSGPQGDVAKTTSLPTPGNGQVTPTQEDQPAEAQPSIEEEVYLDERKLLVDLEQKSADQHDKAMLTLTAGGLALSITFLEKIAPNPLPETLWLIGCSWGCFITSLFAILASFQTSQWACCRQRDILDHKLMGTPGQNWDEGNRWSAYTHRLNITSYACLLAAVLFLACFSWRNIPSGGSKNVGDQIKAKVESKDERPKTGAGTIPPKAPASPVSPTNENKPKPKDKSK